MRHLREGRKLSRTASHRKALLRNLTTALFEHERIETTLEKAKETRRVAERMITHAKRGTIHARRLVSQTVNDPVVVEKLFDTIAPWYAERPGGYTRILRTRSRLGDAGEMAVLELVKTADQRSAEVAAREKAAKESDKKGDKKERKQRRAAPKAPRRERGGKGGKEERHSKHVEKKGRRGDRAGG